VTVALVALGAAVGAPLRHVVSRLFPTAFPWGTLIVNVAGSFLLGLLTVAVRGPWLACFGTGFCGALTTYSTFGYETVRLVQERARLYAALNVVVSVVAGLVAAVLGALLGHLVP
jgi:fluoride exporter